MIGAQHGAFIEIEEIPEPINEPAPPVNKQAEIDYDQVFVDLIKLPVNGINDQSIGNARSRG
jgi:hypothetical protein